MPPRNRRNRRHGRQWEPSQTTIGTVSPFATFTESRKGAVRRLTPPPALRDEEPTPDRSHRRPATMRTMTATNPNRRKIFHFQGRIDPTFRSPPRARPAGSRDAARPAPPRCRRRLRLVDDERPAAGRDPARRAAMPRRSRRAGSRCRRAERVLLASHSHAGRTTLTHRATRAARPADGRRRVVNPPTSDRGSFFAESPSNGA